jgi:Na+-driven multidrug efflux pump
MTVASGVCNMVLDALFVAVFRWGLVGAAAATAIAQILGAIIPLVYFARPNQSLLRLGKFRFDGKALLRTCTNGSSELMTNLSLSVVSILYNLQLIHYAGEDGIAAYGVIMYVNLFFLSVFIGFSIGTAPLIGFNFGADNRKELKNLLRKSIVVLGVSSAAMLVSALVLAKPLSQIFVGYDRNLMDMTVRGFMIYSLSFLLCGYNIFGSSLFTALNNGLISASISFVRTLLCQIVAVMTLPLIFGLDGIWASVVAAELTALVLTTFFVLKYRKRYHYL